MRAELHEHGLDETKPFTLRRLSMEKPKALTVDDIFQRIVSCSTTDKQVVELLVGDRVMTGFFDSGPGCWMVNGGKTRIPEGMYPSHWRPVRP